MRVWAIRVRGTNKYLQLHRSSNTYYQPTEQPRIRFHPTKRGAQNTLTTWLLGPVTWKQIPSTYDGFNGDYNGGETIRTHEYLSERKRENMEIVEFDLVEVKYK